MAAINKRVNEKFAIGLMWTGYLGTGETIQTVDTTIPTGLTKEGSPTIDGITTSQVISGGTALGIYPVVFKITTSAGAIYEDVYTVRLVA